MKDRFEEAMKAKFRSGVQAMFQLDADPLVVPACQPQITDRFGQPTDTVTTDGLTIFRWANLKLHPGGQVGDLFLANFFHQSLQYFHPHV